MSPLFSQTLVFFLNKWSQTYLLCVSNEYYSLSPSLLLAYGPDNGGPKVLDCIVSKLLTNLHSWKHEPSVVSESCNVLLTVSKLRSISNQLSNVPSWQTLLKIHVASDSIFLHLPHKSQIVFWHAMTNLRISPTKESDNVGLQGQFTTQVLMPIHNSLEYIEKNPTFHKIAEQPYVIAVVDRLFAQLTGVTKGTNTRNYKVKKLLFAFFFQSRVSDEFSF